MNADLNETPLINTFTVIELPFIFDSCSYHFYFISGPLITPRGAILREGYSFPDSNSESMSEFVMFISSFLTFELFTCPMWRRGLDGPAPVKGSLGVGDARGVELGYLDD